MKILNRLTKTENSKKILRSLTLLFSEKFLRMISGFFITAWVAKHLGPVEFGKYSFIIQYVLIYVPIVTFGLNELIARDIVCCRDKVEEGEVLGAACAIRFINCIVGFVLIAFSFPFLNIPSEEQMLLLVFSSIFFFYVIGTVDHWFEAKLEYQKLIFARNFGYIVAALLKCYFIFVETSFEYFVLTYFCELLFAKGLGFYIYMKAQGIKHWSISITKMKRYYKESFPLFLVTSLIILEQKIGFVFLKQQSDPSVLGYYSLAFTMFSSLLFMPNALVTTLYPTIIRSKERSYDLYQKRLDKLFGVIVWFSLIFLILFSLYGADLFILIFGEKYRLSTELLKWFCILLVFVSFDVARKKVLILEGQGRAYFISISFFVILSILLQVYFVREYQAVGIIFSSILAFVISNLFISAINMEMRKINMRFVKGFLFPFKKNWKNK